MTGLLPAALAVQFRTRSYRAGVYWLAVALISAVGTLISDNLTDNVGVPLETSTAAFAVILAPVVWHRRERTLSTRDRKAGRGGPRRTHRAGG
ncbi:hypothetical protein [Streptomyces sp. NPDC086787]|uniref:hypothetical protein n=1 Tax=Streptomyces sp. NPDC086787 TaxID=3365759 RepID=UPI0038146B1F